MTDEKEEKLPLEITPGRKDVPTYQVELQGHPDVPKHLRTILVTVDPLRVFIAAVHFGTDETNILQLCASVAMDDRPGGMPCIPFEGYSMIPVDVAARLLRTEDAIAISQIAHDAIAEVMRGEAGNGWAPVVQMHPKNETVH